MSFTKMCSLPFESIFSYLLRLANKNYISLLEILGLCNIAKSRLKMKSIYFINHCPTGTISIQTLSGLIGLPCDKILDMSFYNLLKKFECNDRINNSMILVGLLHREYHYCPRCLSECPPHHQLLWSINIIEICHKHNMRLKKECIHCNQVIQLKDVVDFSYCPYCGGNLKVTREHLEVLNSDYVRNQKWLISNFSYLLTRSDEQLSRKDFAVKLLYLLNGLSPRFDKNRIMGLINDDVNLRMLLEHARDTLSRKKHYNLKAALNILRITNSSFEQLFSINVPKVFYDSLYTIKLNSMTCYAPWCNYRGRLRKSSDSCQNQIRYHLTCYSCGCIYGIDNNNKLVERTYFIDLYSLLLTIKERTISIKEQSRIWRYSVGKILRAIAYFDSRGVFKFENYHVEFDEIKLKSFLAAVESGKPLNDIRISGQWNSFYEYLYYRYRDEVLKAELSCKYKNGAEKVFVGGIYENIENIKTCK